MYRTNKTIDRNADYKVLLGAKDAIKCLRREGVGRVCMITVEVPLPVLKDGEVTGYFPGYKNIRVPRPIAEDFIKDTLEHFEHRGGTIQLHIYAGCIFIGGHYHKPDAEATPT